MELSLQINSVFRVAGWQIVKPLPPLDSWERKADIAQYSKGALVVDFGYFGESRSEGAYRICAVRGEQREVPVAKLDLRDSGMALDLLRQMPGLLGRLGPL